MTSGPIVQEVPFREPWQAKAFALVVLLHREGHFAWDQWVRTLATEVATHPQRPDEAAEAAYHRQFHAALETISAASGLTSPRTLAQRAEQWRRAYLNTPHGHPVDLANAGDDAHAHEADEHDHSAPGTHHHAGGHHAHGLVPQRAPIAISPPRVPPQS